jgi:multiple sugar transport system substrate-binding protein
MSSERKLSRRDFAGLAAGALAAGPFFLFPARARAQQKTLRIAHWSHFVPEYDQWFAQVHAKAWGERHDTYVVVESIPVEAIRARAMAEVVAGKGHDLFMFPWPPAEFQPHVIDHTELYQAVARQHGTVNRIGHKSTFDPKTKTYFALADSWVPAPLHVFQDYWAEVNMPFGPPTYDSLRSGAKRIRAQRGIPAGLALAPSLESNTTLHTLLYGFNSQILDAEGTVTINNARTTAALRFVKALYEDAGTAEQLTWGPSGNVRAMLSRRTSCTLNAISLLRAAEKENPDVAKKILLTPPLMGSAGIVAVPHVTSCSAIWSFAENKDGAKQFLIDFIDDFKTAYEKSEGCNFPMYQNTVPNLLVRLQNDPRADPSWKYEALKDTLHWTANLGFPGFANPVAMEVFGTSVIPKMFASVVRGELSPEDAARSAESDVRRIAEKWTQSQWPIGRE